MSLKKTIQILTLVAVLLVPVQYVSAQVEEDSSETTAERGRGNSDAARELRDQEKEARKVERETNREERVNNAEVRCKIIAKRFETVSSKIEGELARRAQQYDKITERIDRLAVRVELSGIDATGLQGLLELYKSDVQTIVDIARQYQALAADLAAEECGDESSYEEFVLAISDAQDARAALRTAMLEVKSRLQEDIKQELHTIKDQLEAADESAEESSDEEVQEDQSLEEGEEQ